MENQKFYQKTWFMVLMLFLFAPIGIFLIWKYKKFNTVARAILSVFFALAFIGIIMPKSDTTNNTVVSSNATSEPSEEPTEEPKKEESTEEPKKEESTEEPKKEESTEEPTEEPKKEESTKEPEEPTKEPKKKEETADTQSYGDGMYKVGSDIEAGEYILFATSDVFPAYCQVSKDSSGDLYSIISNSNFTYNEIVTIEKGQYLTLQSCKAVPFNKSVEVDTTGSGVFKVGVHIKPGEYKIQVDEGSITGTGYVEVATDSSGTINSIRTNDNITGSTYITVKKGEYLTLTGCHIVE